MRIGSSDEFLSSRSLPRMGFEIVRLMNHSFFLRRVCSRYLVCLITIMSYILKVNHLVKHLVIARRIIGFYLLVLHQQQFVGYSIPLVSCHYVTFKRSLLTIFSRTCGQCVNLLLQYLDQDQSLHDSSSPSFIFDDANVFDGVLSSNTSSQTSLQASWNLFLSASSTVYLVGN